MRLIVESIVWLHHVLHCVEMHAPHCVPPVLTIVDSLVGVAVVNVPLDVNPIAISYAMHSVVTHVIRTVQHHVRMSVVDAVISAIHVLECVLVCAQ